MIPYDMQAPIAVRCFGLTAIHCLYLLFLSQLQENSNSRYWIVLLNFGLNSAKIKIAGSKKNHLANISVASGVRFVVIATTSATAAGA